MPIFFCTFVYYGQLQAKINELQQNYVIGDYPIQKQLFYTKVKGKIMKNQGMKLIAKAQAVKAKKTEKI